MRRDEYQKQLIEVVQASNELMEKNTKVLEQLSSTLETLTKLTIDNRNMLIFVSGKINEKP